MTFTIGNIARCAGQSHYQIPITINGVTRTLHTDLEELEAAAPEGFEEARAAIISRIRSALLEANAVTIQQKRVALEGKVFEV